VVPRSWQPAGPITLASDRERLVRTKARTVAWHSTHLEAMRVTTLDNIIYINEVFSLENDKARGDTNLVRLLMREHGCGLTEATDLVRGRAHADAQTFLAAEGAYPSCATLWD
jgi:Terpene synthase family 2, C-terminal metal binding